MIEFLSYLSVFLGYILHISAQFALVGLILYGLIKLIDGKSSCNQNCNQGRNCNCKGQ